MAERAPPTSACRRRPRLAVGRACAVRLRRGVARRWCREARERGPSVSAGRVANRHQQPGVITDRSGIAPVIVETTREPVRQCFGDRHSVRLLLRGEDANPPGRRHARVRNGRDRRRIETRSSMPSDATFARTRPAVAGSRVRLPAHVRRHGKSRVAESAVEHQFVTLSWIERRYGQSSRGTERGHCRP